MNINKIILIGDTVVLQDRGDNKNRYCGQEGKVLETRLNASANELEHRVEFAPLPLTEEEQDAMAYVITDDGRRVLNLDHMVQEHIMWCLTSEIKKVGLNSTIG